MSEVLTKMLTRRSIRKFKPDRIPREVLEQIVTAGTFAATGRNLQSPIILAVTNKEIRDRLSALNAAAMGASNDPFYGAPVVLVVLADKSCRTHLYDGSLVMGNLMLAAHELGIGSCWIHRAKEVMAEPKWQEWLKSLGLEGDYEGIGNLVLGYPDGEMPPVKETKEGRVVYVK